MEQLKAAGDRLLKAPPAPPANLTPPAQVRNDQLRDWVNAPGNNSMVQAQPCLWVMLVRLFAHRCLVALLWSISTVITINRLHAVTAGYFCKSAAWN